MQNDMVGYLLGLLEQEDEILIARLLDADAEARTQMEIFQCGLKVFEIGRDPGNPPEGLAVRTCQWLRTISQNRSI